MKTEQDIRTFMKENRIPVPEDKAFMDDLIRQINLLPVPASLSEKEESIQENIRMVKAIYESVRKYYRRHAIMVAAANVVIGVMLFLATYFFLTPEVLTGDTPALQFILTWRYMLTGLACLAVLALTISRTNLIRI